MFLYLMYMCINLFVSSVVFRFLLIGDTTGEVDLDGFCLYDSSEITIIIFFFHREKVAMCRHTITTIHLSIFIFRHLFEHFDRRKKRQIAMQFVWGRCMYNVHLCIYDAFYLCSFQFFFFLGPFCALYHAQMNGCIDFTMYWLSSGCMHVSCFVYLGLNKLIFD